MSAKTTVSCAPGFAGLLAVAFIVLRLCQVIDWSWWWVLSPIWIPLAIFLIASALFIILAAVVANLPKKSRR